VPVWLDISQRRKVQTVGGGGAKNNEDELPKRAACINIISKGEGKEKQHMNEKSEEK
jgi:hypothetical protein